MTNFIEKFVQHCARQNADRIQVRRIDDTTVRLTLGNRTVDVAMDQLIMQDVALKAISDAVDDLFGMFRVLDPLPPLVPEDPANDTNDPESST